MCDPATGLAVAKAGVGFIQQNAEAKQQNARYEANRVNAINARDLKISQLNLRGQQEQEKNQQEQQALSVESLRQQARAIAAAGEAGVGGHSVDALLRDFEAQKLRGLTNLSTDSDNLSQQLNMEREGLDAEMMSRIGSVAQAEQPSLGMAVLGGAMDAAGAYASVNGTDALFGIPAKAGAATGFTYGTNPFSQQSMMLAAQEF